MYVYLNGVPLLSLSPSIVLLDVEELAPEELLEVQARGAGDGAVVTRVQRQALRIRLRLELHEPDLALRKALCTQIAGWASGGGTLVISDRPGQELSVRCEALPVLSSSLHWTQPVTLVFAALDCPYWRCDRNVTVNSAAAKSHTLTLHPLGNAAPVPIEAFIRNAADVALMWLSVVTPLGYFTFEYLTVAPGHSLIISELAGVPLATVDGVSVLANRVPQSSDRLMVQPGADNVIYVNGDQAVEVSVSARGSWY